MRHKVRSKDYGRIVGYPRKALEPVMTAALSYSTFAQTSIGPSHLSGRSFIEHTQRGGQHEQELKRNQEPR